MTRTPASALIIGFLGLVPFVWGALMALGILDGTINNPLASGTALMGAEDGADLMIRYGAVILPFMSGVLWGFATYATGTRATVAYALSVLPVVWWLLLPTGSDTFALGGLVVGYAGLLGLDHVFQRWELAPPWWMSLRLQLTAVVLVCLATGLLTLP